MVGAAGVLIVALVVVSIDLYVGSKGVRTWVETALSREVGLPVSVGALHYSLWGGLQVKDVDVTSGAMGTDGGAPSSIVVPKASARVAFWPLISGRVVVRKLLFQEPSLVWSQREDGGWNLPLEKRRDEGISSPPVPEAKVVEKSPKLHKRSKLEFKVESVQIKNAALRFVDRAKGATCLLEGVTVHCPMLAKTNAEGTLAVRKATLPGGLIIEGFTAPFQFSGNSLALSPLDARLSGGSLRGSGTITTTSKNPPFTLDLLFDGVDLNRLLADVGAGQTTQRTEGQLHGNLDLYGWIGKKKSLAGAGQVRLRGGQMEQFPLVQLICQVLLIDAKDIELRQAQLDLRAGEGKVFVDSLVLESADLNITAKGTSEFDGKLDLAARLALTSKVSRQLPGWVDANFQPVPGSDRRDIAFGVTGTLSHPKTDLVEVMVGQKLSNQFKNLWQSLTGKHKKKSGDKKKPESEATPVEEGDGVPEQSPEAAPAVTPKR